MPRSRRLLGSRGVQRQRKRLIKGTRPWASFCLLAVFLGANGLVVASLAEETEATGPRTKERARVPPPQTNATPFPSNTVDADDSLDAASSKRLYADAFITWIYKNPERDAAPIGYIRGGQSVALRATDATPAGVPKKRGCGRGWYAVEPAGYVCLDHTASLTPTRYSESMRDLAPRPGPYPFDFALSMGSPSYRRIPTQGEWLRKERIFGEAKPRPLPPHFRSHEELVTDQRLLHGPRPEYLEENGSVARAQETRLVRRDVPFGSMLAVNGSFEASGRSFLTSADGTVVPADRFRLFRPSTFEGVDLRQPGEAGLHLPLAWPRKETQTYSLSSSPSCAVDGSGTRTTQKIEASGPPGRIGTRPAQLSKDCLLKREQTAATRKVLALSGRVVDVAGTRFVELGSTSAEQNVWVPLRHVYLAQKRERNATSGADTKWIHFTINEGTLVSYQGDKAVFATLASPGIGGVPNPGDDPLSTRTTPIGTYRIHFKHRTDDMSPEQTEDRSYWIADVPFAMYFKQPFAIHVAYWHESFGEPMSGGCINVSPRDGERLFAFTDPQLPEDWYGVSASKEFGLGTTVVIDR